MEYIVGKRINCIIKVVDTFECFNYTKNNTNVKINMITSDGTILIWNTPNLQYNKIAGFLGLSCLIQSKKDNQFLVDNCRFSYNENNIRLFKLETLNI